MNPSNSLALAPCFKIWFWKQQVSNRNGRLLKLGLGASRLGKVLEKAEDVQKIAESAAIDAEEKMRFLSAERPACKCLSVLRRKNEEEPLPQGCNNSKRATTSHVQREVSGHRHLLGFSQPLAALQATATCIKNILVTQRA